MKERNNDVREKHQSVASYTLHVPQLEAEPTTQACALTEN